MTQRELERLCRKWQERLRLGDWHVTVELSRLHDNNAECSHDRDRKRAHIRVHPEATDDFGERIDLEELLVHELGHLLFAPFENQVVPEGEKANTDVEFAINAYAQALVGLDRGTPG